MRRSEMVPMAAAAAAAAALPPLPAVVADRLAEVLAEVLPAGQDAA